MAMTVAPADTATSIAVASTAGGAGPLVVTTRIGRILTSGAMPISPLWGIGWAAMRPAIAVPRPAQSTSPRPLRDTTSAPGSTRPASCGTAGSTPEPTMATMTPAPLVRRQARSGARRSCAHGGVASTGSVARVRHRAAIDGVASPVAAHGWPVRWHWPTARVRRPRTQKPSSGRQDAAQRSGWSSAFSDRSAGRGVGDVGRRAVRPRDRGVIAAPFADAGDHGPRGMTRPGPRRIYGRPQREVQLVASRGSAWRAAAIAEVQRCAILALVA